MGAKIGSIVLSTVQGLGILAKDFYDNGIIDEVLIHQHTSRENHPEWYPNACKNEKELLSKIDTLLLFETAWDWKVIVRAREKGIKTVLMPMFECTTYPLPYQPDLILCPSKLDMEYYKEGREVVVPVDALWQLRSKAKKFIHNAGNGGLGGRNGTREVIEAMKYVKQPIELLIRSQIPLNIPNDNRIEVRIGTFSKEQLFIDGDVFLFPEKFNGLSLPLQEAYASGMLVMCGDRFPMNTWLPKEPLIPVHGYRKEKIAVEFDMAVFHPKTIGETIDRWYDQNIEKYSLMGKEWGAKHSWKNLKNMYLELLQ